MKLKPIFNIAGICASKGISQAILSPGSRCAPLTLAFNRHPDIDCKSISDERSAAFIGLGIAQQLNQPVVLTCTSGSAAYNYAPGIAEAYFQQVPLIILTADRPPEWIDQLDGQTIRQNKIYGDHVKESFSLPVDLTHKDAEWHAYRIISEAVNKSTEFPKGPVHVNIPFREPFYPDADEEIGFDDTIKVIEECTPTSLEVDMEPFRKVWNASNRKLIVCGQQQVDKGLSNLLADLSKKHRIPVAGDIISNQHLSDTTIAHSDLFLANDEKGLWKSLESDLLITFGKSIISKNLKLFLRKHKPKHHWHIQPNGQVADTYQSLTQIARTHPEFFFQHLVEDGVDDTFDQQKQENYYHIWEIEERKTNRALSEFFEKDKDLSELRVVNSAIANLPKSANLHLANSMSVRYANFIGLDVEHDQVEVFANRGTSGIDGSNSTAVGTSLVTDKLNVLITGDMAFFYDRNAFWHNHNIDNLRVILLNNHGGGIFGMIKGPKEQKEYAEFFETEQRLTAKSLAQEFGFEYLHCDKKSKLKNYISQLFDPDSKTTILEVETNSEYNASQIAELKKVIKEIK